jgi:hypothetical protein
MPRLVCRFIYVECHVLVVTSLQSDQLYAYFSTSFHMLYVRSHMPVAVCLHLYAGTWLPSSSLWVAKLAYMSNCNISVYMPNALFQELCTEWYGLYAKIHMLDCNMPNAMTIAMPFRMTTEQVGYFVIHVYYPAMTLHIAVTEKKLLLYHQSFSLYLKVSGISVCRHIMAKGKVSVCRHMIYWYPGQHILYPGQHISSLRSQVYQFVSISGY